MRRQRPIGAWDTGHKLITTLVLAVRVGEAKIVMVAAGHHHYLAVTVDGDMYTLGCGQGQFLCYDNFKYKTAFQNLAREAVDSCTAPLYTNSWLLCLKSAGVPVLSVLSLCTFAVSHSLALHIEAAHSLARSGHFLVLTSHTIQSSSYTQQLHSLLHH